MNAIKNLPITMKIAFSFFLLFVAIAGFGIWTYQFSGTVRADSALILEESLPFAQLAEQMSRDTIQVQQWLTDISATRGQDGLDDGFAEAQKSYQSFMTGLGKFEQMFQEENESAALNKSRSLRTKFTNYYETGKKMAKPILMKGLQVVIK